MEISTYVIGFNPLDKRWCEVKAVYDSCIKACIEVPLEVYNFFNGNPNKLSGITVYIDEIPNDVKIIRFIDSW